MVEQVGFGAEFFHTGVHTGHIVQEAVFFVNGSPDGSPFKCSVCFFIFLHVHENVIVFVDQSVGAVLVVNAPLAVILRTVHLFLGNARSESTRELILALDNAMFLAARLHTHLPLFPEGRHLLLVTLTHRAVFVIAKALLGPKRTLSFQIDHVSAEERRGLEISQNWIEVLVEFFEGFNGSAGAVEFS